MTKKILQMSMVLLSCVLLFAGHFATAQTISNSQTGTQNGWYWSFWKDNGTASMTLQAGGRYTTTWSGVNNFTAGKGWQTGSPNRLICFSGTFNGGSNGYLAVYGWTKNALIEYYVVENYGSWTPPGNIANKGTFSSDGSTYTIYQTDRINQPSIEGNSSTFKQYWSVRSSKRSSGTVTFANHVAAWKAAGMNMGTTWDYQIVETEGYQSTGSSDITVLDACGSSCATAAPTGTLSYTYEVGDVAKQLTATGTSLKWYADNTTTTPLSGAPTPATDKTGTTTYYVSQTANNCEGPRAEITVRVVQTYKIFKTSAPLTIDGNMEDSWSDALVVPMNATKLLSGAVSNTADLSGYGKLLWDNSYLYFLAVVTDDTKKNDSPNSYDDDCVELYIDGDNAKASTYDANDCQYSFGWDDGTIVGTIPSTASTTNITYSAVATANGYVVEARLPWTTIQATPAANKILGIDFMINDDDDGSTRDAKLSFNAATDDAYQNASLFGSGKLYDQTVITGNDNASIEQISIYPNPATTDLHITGFTQNFEYVLFDVTGRALLEGHNAEKINISKLEPGSYMVRVKQGDRYKIVKISKL